MWCEHRHVCLIQNSPLKVCNRGKNSIDKILASVLRTGGLTNLTLMKNLQSLEEKSCAVGFDVVSLLACCPGTHKHLFDQMLAHSLQQAWTLFIYSHVVSGVVHC